jgi:hypothetical protein
MTNLRLCGKGFCVRRLLPVLALLACGSTAALGANNITGSVRNESCDAFPSLTSIDSRLKQTSYLRNR